MAQKTSSRLLSEIALYLDRYALREEKTGLFLGLKAAATVVNDFAKNERRKEDRRRQDRRRRRSV